MIHSRQQKLSLVVPVFNEEESIRPFLDRTVPVLERAAALVPAETSYEILFINDGSTDATAAVLSALAQRDARIKLVNLSRNFGKEAAVAAGLNYASGDAIIPIDVDLQDPPELIEPMVVKWLAGAKAVEAVRTDRTSDSGTSASPRTGSTLSTIDLPTSRSARMSGISGCSIARWSRC